MNHISNRIELPTNDPRSLASGAPPAPAPPSPTPVSNEEMQRLLGGSAPRHAFLLRKGPAWENPDLQPQQWEHARNMFTLMRAGRLRYICALMDGSDVVGFGVFDVPSREEAAQLLREDPGVRCGRLTWELLAGTVFTPSDVG